MANFSPQFLPPYGARPRTRIGLRGISHIMLLYQVHDFCFHNSVQPHIVKALSHVFLHKAVGFGDVFGANEVVVLRFLFIAVVIDEYVYQRGLVERLAFFLLVDYLDNIRAGDREYIAISVVLFKSFFLGLGEQYYIGDEVR